MTQNPSQLHLQGKRPAPKKLPPKPPKTTVNTVNINLNRKLMSHQIVNQLRDTVRSQGMIAGSAVGELMDEYDRLRYLVEGLVTAYMRGDEHKVRKVLDVFRILL